nr:hypothetical protein [Paenibacillus sp.]
MTKVERNRADRLINVRMRKGPILQIHVVPRQKLFVPSLVPFLKGCEKPGDMTDVRFHGSFAVTSSFQSVPELSLGASIPNGGQARNFQSLQHIPEQAPPSLPFQPQGGLNRNRNSSKNI